MGLYLGLRTASPPAVCPPNHMHLGVGKGACSWMAEYSRSAYPCKLVRRWGGVAIPAWGRPGDGGGGGALAHGLLDLMARPIKAKIQHLIPLSSELAMGGEGEEGVADDQIQEMGDKVTVKKGGRGGGDHRRTGSWGPRWRPGPRRGRCGSHSPPWCKSPAAPGTIPSGLRTILGHWEGSKGHTQHLLGRLTGIPVNNSCRMQDSAKAASVTTPIQVPPDTHLHPPEYTSPPLIALQTQGRHFSDSGEGGWGGKLTRAPKLAVSRRVVRLTIGDHELEVGQKLLDGGVGQRPHLGGDVVQPHLVLRGHKLQVVRHVGNVDLGLRQAACRLSNLCGLGCGCDSEECAGLVGRQLPHFFYVVGWPGCKKLGLSITVNTVCSLNIPSSLYNQ